MKRLPISYLELLRDILPRDRLSSAEAAALERAIASTEPSLLRETAQGLVQALIDRGELRVIGTVLDETGRLVRLQDPKSTKRFLLRLDPAREAESLEVIPLPLPADPVSGIRADLVRSLVSDLGSLVLSDRVAGPREIIQRLEPAIRDALGIESVALLPVNQPPGQLWRVAPPGPLSLPEVRLRELAESRSYLLHVRDFSRLDRQIAAVPRSGSGLYLGLGDEKGEWAAVLEARDGGANSFNRERIHLAVLLAGHFQTLLANAVRLQSFMFHDYLTGLHNRPYFEDQLDKIVSSALRHETRFALCIVDVDDFKNFNTLYGYEGGDRVLATVACVLKAALRTTDTIARYGGEEFAVLLAPPVDREEAELIAERLRNAVESEPFQVQGLSGRYVPERITVSIGGALFPEHGPEAPGMWNTANRMLLYAKGEGKNRVRFAEAPPDDDTA